MKTIFQNFIALVLLFVCLPVLSADIVIQLPFAMRAEQGSVIWSSDGNYIITGDLSGTISVFSATDGAKIQSCYNQNSINALAMTKDNRYIFSGDDAGHLTMWSMETGERCWDNWRDFEDRNALYYKPIFAFSLSDDGSKLMLTRDETREIWSINYTDTSISSIWLAFQYDPIFSVALSKDANTCLVGSGNGTVWFSILNDNLSYKLLRNRDERDVLTTFFSPNEKKVACASRYDIDDDNNFESLVEIFDIQAASEIPEFSFTGWAASLSPDMSKLFFCGPVEEHYVGIRQMSSDWQLGDVVWRYDTTELWPKEYPYGYQPDFDMAKFSPDGKTVACYKASKKKLFVFSLEENTAVPTSTPVPNLPTPTPIPTGLGNPNIVIVPSPPILYADNQVYNKRFIAKSIADNNITVIPVTYIGKDYYPAEEKIVSLMNSSALAAQSIGAEAQDEISNLLKLELLDADTASLYVFCLDQPVEAVLNSEVKLSVSAMGDGSARLFIGIMDINADGSLRVSHGEFVPYADKWQTYKVSRTAETGQVVFLIQAVGPGELFISQLMATIVVE